MAICISVVVLQSTIIQRSQLSPFLTFLLQLALVLIKKQLLEMIDLLEVKRIALAPEEVVSLFCMQRNISETEYRQSWRTGARVEHNARTITRRAIVRFYYLKRSSYVGAELLSTSGERNHSEEGSPESDWKNRKRSWLPSQGSLSTVLHLMDYKAEKKGAETLPDFPIRDVGIVSPILHSLRTVCAQETCALCFSYPFSSVGDTDDVILLF